MIYDDSWLFHNAFGWFMAPSTIWFSRASCSSRSCRCVWHWDDISYPRRLETKDIAWEVYIHAHLINGPWIFIIHMYPLLLGRGYTQVLFSRRHCKHSHYWTMIAPPCPAHCSAPVIQGLLLIYLLQKLAEADFSKFRPNDSMISKVVAYTDTHTDIMNR